MIIGDSFTETYFAPMLLQHTGRVVWAYQHSCQFDWKLVDQFHPAEIGGCRPSGSSSVAMETDR
jgi:hypothetical protein